MEDEDYKEILKNLFNNKMHKRLKYTLIEAVKRVEGNIFLIHHESGHQIC